MHKSGQSCDISDALRGIYDATQSIYHRHARHWHEERADVFFARPWAEKIARHIEAAFATHHPVRILDLGCGGGMPFARYFLDKGWSVTGIDYAPAMIAMAQENHPAARYPHAQWHIADMRAPDTMEKILAKAAGEPVQNHYHAIISWDGFFHLSRQEQRVLLPKTIDMLCDDGLLLLSVGDGDGEVTGIVCGETVYHASLSSEEYHAILADAQSCDIELIMDAPDSWGRHILQAVKGHKRP